MNDERNESAIWPRGEAIVAQQGPAGFAAPAAAAAAPALRCRAETADARRKAPDRHEHDAAGVPRLDRSIDSRQRAADHRPRVRRRHRAALGDHVVPDRRDRADAALRQIRRHPWPPRHAVDCAGHLYGRRDRLGIGVKHADADLRPRRAGHGRRRHDFERPDGAGRHGSAQGARQILHLFLDRIHHRRRLRPGAWRLDLRSPLLVDDFFMENPVQHHRHGAGGEDASAVCRDTAGRIGSIFSVRCW